MLSERFVKLIANFMHLSREKVRRGDELYYLDSVKNVTLLASTRSHTFDPVDAIDEVVPWALHEEKVF